jgi:hypothetical protein
MPKPVTINLHLSVKQLESRYRAAKNPVERSHYQIVWLLAQGKTTEEVALEKKNWHSKVAQVQREHPNSVVEPTVLREPTGAY